MAEEAARMPKQRQARATGCAASEAVQSRRIVDQNLAAYRFVRHPIYSALLLFRMVSPVTMYLQRV